MARYAWVTGAVLACGSGITSAESKLTHGPRPARGEPDRRTPGVAASQPADGVLIRFYGRIGRREVHVAWIEPAAVVRARRERVAAAWEAASQVRAVAEAARERRRQEWLERRRERERQRHLEAMWAHEARMAAMAVAQREAEARAERAAALAPLLAEIDDLRREAQTAHARYTPHRNTAFDGYAPLWGWNPRKRDCRPCPSPSCGPACPTCPHPKRIVFGAGVSPPVRDARCQNPQVQNACRLR